MSQLIKPEPTKVDGNTGQIVEVHPSTEEIVVYVRNFLELKEKKVFFNGKRYAEIEDFQYIGTFYGITVKTFDPHFVEIGGRKGFHAKALLLRDQQEIGRAEAFCLDDEPNWRNKPLFQLASMAQTRAAAKAYSNLFRPIVRMAGIEGTPAEEMDGGDHPALPQKQISQAKIEELGQRFDKPKEDEFGPLPEIIDESDEELIEEPAQVDIPIEIPKPPPKGARTPISEKQVKLLWVLTKQAGISEVIFRAYLSRTYGIENSKDIEKSEMEKVMEWIKRFKYLEK